MPGSSFGYNPSGRPNLDGYSYPGSAFSRPPESYPMPPNSYGNVKPDFEWKMEHALSEIRAILDATRHPQLPSNVEHQYADKFQLAEFVGKTAISFNCDLLTLLGLTDQAVGRALDWRRRECAVRVELASTSNTKFLREVNRTVTIPSKLSTRTGTVDTFETSVVVDYVWEFSVDWLVRLLPGESCLAQLGPSEAMGIVLNGRQGRVELKTATKRAPRPAATVNSPVVADLTWLLDHASWPNTAPYVANAVPTFTIDRLQPACKTPRQNPQVEKLLASSVDLQSFADRVRWYMVGELFAAENEGRPDRFDTDSLTALDTFIPIVPLLEARLPANCEFEGTSCPAAPAEVLSAEDRAALVAAADKSLRQKLEKLQRVFPAQDKARVVSTVEAQFVAVVAALGYTQQHLSAALDYLEELLRKQLTQAIGRSIGTQDLVEFMDYHNQRLYAPGFKPKPVVLSVRREGHDEEGTVALEMLPTQHQDLLYTSYPPISPPGKTKNSASPVQSWSVEDEMGVAGVPAMSFPVSSATKITFTGKRTLHAVMLQHFSGEGLPSLQLALRARQFSSFALLLGTLGAEADEFVPSHGIILQNKDEVLIPLLAESVPAPQEFRDAIRSLSPEQQRFAKAFREMQLSSTVFALCLVQIKPQLETVLNLPPSALTKHISLTQTLLDMFLTYQIPSDLLSYDGPAQATLEEKVERVQELADAMKAMIKEQKEQELKDAEDQAKKKKFNQQGEDVNGQVLPEMPPVYGPVMYMAAPGAPMMADDMGFSAGKGYAGSSKSAPAPTVDMRVGGNIGGAPAPVNVATGGSSALPVPEQVDGKGLTALPGKLDKALLEHAEETTVRPTILSPGAAWPKKASPGLLSPRVSSTLYADEQASETARTFDLLSALTRSGELELQHTELHVFLAATHSFDRSLMEAVIEDNANPIEQLESSSLLLTSTVLAQRPDRLLAPNQLARLQAQSPALFGLVPPSTSAPLQPPSATLIAPLSTTSPYPAHWGSAPEIQTMDYRKLPGGYGWGSSTLANWIEQNMKKDASMAPPTLSKPLPPLQEWKETTTTPSPYPAHWGSPPAIQTMDFRELPGGYGFGSSTLANWISSNMEKDGSVNTYATTTTASPYPAHWGSPPEIQTRDYRDLPGGYGMGSSTLAAWIRANMDKDADAAAGATGTSVTDKPATTTASGHIFPDHWGAPPAIQTMDLVALPAGYGFGSSTLRNWIQHHLDKDGVGKVALEDGGVEDSSVWVPDKGAGQGKQGGSD
eukprot:g58018.t1